jgi:hypothetical protein
MALSIVLLLGKAAGILSVAKYKLLLFSVRH